MTSKNILNPNFEWSLNKILTQEEKDLLRLIIQEIKEKNTRRMLEKLNDEYLQTHLEEYAEFLEEEKKLQYELEQQLEELKHCENEDLVKDVIEDIKQDIRWNVSVQTRLIEKIQK